MPRMTNTMPVASTESYGGRYILPQFEERTPDGIKFVDPYSKMFEQRIVFLAAPIDVTSSSDVVAQLLALDYKETSEITLYINSPGGSLIDAATIIDAMNLVRSDIRTVCIGQVSEVSALVLASGTKGKRNALPNAHITLYQPKSSGNRGQASDIMIHSAHIKKMRQWMEELLAQQTGKDAEDVHKDIERELFMNAEEACAYGLVDAVLKPTHM